MKKILALAWGVVLACAGVFAGDLVSFRPGQDLSPSAPLVASVDGQVGRSGFAFVVEFTAKDGHAGSVVSKPGVFSLDISGAAGNRTYTLKMFGDNRWCSATETDFSKLVATGESEIGKPERVACVATYYCQPEQSRIGYMISIYLNGELIGSQGASHFGPTLTERQPVVFGEGVDIRSVALADRSCSVAELFPNLPGAAALGNWKDAATQAWKAAQKGVRFLENDRLVVAVSEKETVGSPVVGGWNRETGDVLFGTDGLAWELELEGKGGLPVRVRSSSRRIRSTTAFRDGGFVVTSVGEGFTVRHGVKIAGGRIERMLETEDTVGARIRGAMFPKATLVKLPGEDKIVQPIFSGTLTRNPTMSYRHTGNYPEDCATMAFAAYYNAAGEGLYFAAEDPKAVTKAYSAEGVGGKLTLGYFQSAPRDAGQKGAKRFAPSGRGVLELYTGAWYEAGQVYRRFLQASAPWYDAELPRKDTPEWFMNNPLWIVNLNLTHARKPAVRYLRSYFDITTSFVTGAVTPPDGHGGFGPNYAIMDEVKDCYEELRKDDTHFVCYTNPRLWYAGPAAEKSNNYSATGKRWALKKENGEPYVERYGATAEDDYVTPCPAVTPWREHLCRRTKRVALDASLDGIYHDQLPCASPYLCFDPDHGHKAGDPAAWLSLGNWKFCDYLMGDLRKELPYLAHTAEECSEPFVNRVDGFVTWRFGLPGHVPLFQSLYAPRVQFVGRGCDCHRWPGTYESFFPKYAEQLCYGEQIGWTSYPMVSFPSPRRGYLKKLAHCRAALATFLNASEMQAPLTFAEKPEQFCTGWGVMEYNPTTVDKVLTSVWRNRDGRQVVMFLNTVDAPQEVKPVWNRGGGTFTICRETSGTPESANAAPPRVKVAPYGFEFWFVGDAASPEAAPLAKALAKSASFPWKNRGAMLSLAPAFGKTVEQDATDGKTVTEKAAAWGLLAYIPNYNMMDSFPHDESQKGGWAAAQDGGLVNYGTVDFGAGAKALELNCATDEQGVRVEFFDVTGDVPVRRIAEFRPAAAGWHDYAKRVSPLFGTVTGKRAVVCRVTGGICNLRGWRLLKEGTSAAEQPVETRASGPVDFAKAKSFAVGADIAAADAAWALFARPADGALALDDGGYASYGTVDLGKTPETAELTVASADPNAVVDLVDISEFAPSTPLATFRAKAGTVVAPIEFKVAGTRSVILRVHGGACVLKGWKVVQHPAELIPSAEMQAVYEEIKTPYKYGVILEPEKGEMLDNPNVFRHGDAWYMMHIVFDNKGYETRLAKSSDLLHWQPLGPILLRGKDGAWDCAQSDGGPSLMDMRWEGPNTLGTCGGKYWMTYIGGAKNGYETDPLSIGVATTDDPSVAKLWTRALDRPVLATWDGDVRWFEDATLYKSYVVTDEARTLGGKYVMYYNAKTGEAVGRRVPWLESIGMAVSDDMLTWKRYGKSPVILNWDAPNKAAISGDPMIRKIGDKWVMFYFGCLWGDFRTNAGETFAVSRDLVNWTKWTGKPLIAASEPWDGTHAHKPWVIKHDGVVYHFYCAVGDRGRVLALATSKDLKGK